MGWFASQLLVYLVAAFLLGLLTGYLLWIFGWKARAAGAGSSVAAGSEEARATAVLVDVDRTGAGRARARAAGDPTGDPTGDDEHAGDEVLRTRVAQLEAGLEERTDELAALRDELDARSRELEVRRNEMVAALARAEALEAELHEVGDERDAAEARAAELIAAAADRPAVDAADAGAGQERDPDAVEGLRQANELLTAVLAERDRELAEARAAASQEPEAAQQERGAADEQLDRLWSRLAVVLDERTGLEDRLAAARLELVHRRADDRRADEAATGLSAAAAELAAVRTALDATGTELEATRAELDATRAELATAEREAARVQQALDEAAPPVPTATPVPTAPVPTAAQPIAPAATPADQLERIEGIGAKIAAVLRAAGVDTFAAIAALDDAGLRRALASGGVRSHPTLPTWRAQAALLAAGDEAAFAALRHELVAGRPRRPKAAKVGR
ncbi:MAG: hypothetical protein AB7O92_16310 [Acidimicrobiia bacterium]